MQLILISPLEALPPLLCVPMIKLHGLGRAHDQVLTSLSILTLGQRVWCVDGLETVSRMVKKCETFLLQIARGLDCWLGAFEGLLCHQEGRACMGNSHLHGRWGVRASMVLSEYMDPALTEARVYSWTFQLHKLLLSQSSE